MTPLAERTEMVMAMGQHILYYSSTPTDSFDVKLITIKAFVDMWKFHVII